MLYWFAAKGLMAISSQHLNCLEGTLRTANSFPLLLGVIPALLKLVSEDKLAKEVCLLE